MIVGIDEAGRGAVIGPMVIAGVAFEEQGLKKLSSLGVRDSKELSKSRREELAKKIEEIGRDMVLIKVGPCKIDSYRKSGINLNEVEALKMIDIIRFLSPKKVYIDCPSNNIEKFVNFIKKSIDESVEIIAEHNADKRFPVVSAASIVAKVARDKEIERIKRKYGNVGSGYPSDERAIKWLKEYHEKHGKFPRGVVRETWETLADLGIKKGQKSILNFLRRFKK